MITLWRIPDWRLSHLATHDDELASRAIEEYRRRIALKDGQCLCDEILRPEDYEKYPLGVCGQDTRSQRIKEIKSEIEELEGEIDDLRHDLRLKENELRGLQRAEPCRIT